MRVVTDNLGFLLGGLLVTLELTVLGFVGALLLGTVLAVFRVSPIAPLRWVGAVYVEVLRNMPLLTLLILVVFGLPDVGITFSLFTSAAVCMAAFAAAFVCEAVRGGINTVPVGQAEAARSLGFTFTQSLRYVILPPAFRTMVQPLVNIFIGVVLGSSLASAVGVSELTNRTQVLNLQSAEAVVLFLVSGAIYLAIALLGGAAGGALERRVSGGRPDDRGEPRRVLFDEPGPRGRARIRIFTVIGLLLVAGIVALALYQFYSNGQLGRSRWLPSRSPPTCGSSARDPGTIIATAVAAVLSFPLGVVLALGRLSRNGLLRRVSTWYIELFRSIPLLLLIYAFLLALPRYGINLPILWKLVVPIVLVNVAVLAEIFRAGILAVDRGQSEAAAALGLREGPAMRSVILPQAIRLVIPTLVTQLVALLKDSTLGYVVSYPELMKQARTSPSTPTCWCRPTSSSPRSTWS